MATEQTLAQRAAGGGSYVNRALFISLIALTIVLFPPLAAHKPWHDTFSTYFIAIVLEAVPYILIGSLLAGLIELFMPATLLPRLTSRLGLLGIPAVAVVAPVFPACECGVLAVARGLMRKGLPLPHTVTYLLAGPIMNPTVLFTTWLAFQDARYPILRAVGGLFVAISVGLVLWRVNPRRILLAHVVDQQDGHDHQGHDHHAHPHGVGCDDDCKDPAPMVHLGAALKKTAPGLTPTPAATPAPRRSVRTTIGQLSANVIDHFLEMAAFFLMGVFIAAAMKTWFGNAAFSDLGATLVLAPLAMMLTAFILSLCAEADAFVAASFSEFSLPALLAFLVFGPMFDIKLFLMYRVVFRTSFIFAIAGALVVLVLFYVLVLVPPLDGALTALGIGRGAL